MVLRQLAARGRPARAHRKGSLRDRDDTFALLEYLGAESSGALTLLPVGRSPYGIQGLQPLPHEELSRRILGLPRTTLTREAPKQAAFAGAQHKMLAVLKGLDAFEPLGSTVSTHILKPDHPWREAYPASACLEWLTMRLAASAHLRVPSVEFFRVPQPVYAIERFDRLDDPAEFAPETGAAPPEVKRVHAIDACQMLNKSRFFKHGAGVRALREASQACTDKVATAVQLFRWLLFNLLVANDDCHLKNLSFLVTPGRIELSPHYDLLATGVYHTSAVANEKANWPAVPLAVGLSAEVTRFDQVTPRAVLAAALELGVPDNLALQMTRDVVTKVLGAFDATYAEHCPQQEGLLTQLNARRTEPDVQELDTPEMAVAPAAAAGAHLYPVAHRLLEAIWNP